MHVEMWRSFDLREGDWWGMARCIATLWMFTLTHNVTNLQGWACTMDAA